MIEMFVFITGLRGGKTMAAQKWTEKKDMAADRKAGIKEGSKRDQALDRKRGLPPDVAKKGPRKGNPFGAGHMANARNPIGAGNSGKGKSMKAGKC